MQIFNYIITTAIVANIIILASTVYGESAVFTKAKEDCNYAFTAIFIIEAVVKVTGLGWHNYWRSGWNKFDFFLILMAIIDIIFTQTAQGAQVSHFGIVALAMQSVFATPCWCGKWTMQNNTCCKEFALIAA